MLNSQSMKHLSGVLKDIKDIHMIKSEADLREQEARIAHLERATAADNPNKDPIRVIIEGGADEYSH